MRFSEKMAPVQALAPEIDSWIRRGKPFRVSVIRERIWSPISFREEQVYRTLRRFGSPRSKEKLNHA
jgi:hypothetical protein